MSTPSPEPPRRLRWAVTVRFRLMLVAVVAVLALVALVAVNAAQDWRQQSNLRNDSATGRLGGEASLPLFVGAQAERRDTAAYLAHPDAAAKKALDKQRAATDKGISSFRHLSGTELQTSERHKWPYVERVYKELDKLPDIRRQADARSADADRLTGYYTGLIVKMIEFYQELSAMDDPKLTVETRALVGLFWASDGLAQEDMLIAQARASGRMTAAHRAAFAESYGTQQVMYRRWIAPYLPKKDLTAYRKMTSGAAWKNKQRIERAVIAAPTASGAVTHLPSELRDWNTAYGTVAQQIAALNLSRTQGLLAHGFQRADEIRAQAWRQIGGSLAAVVVLAALIFWTIRSVTSRLGDLRTTAASTAERLPDVVRRLQAGQEVDVTREFPAPRDRGDEFTGLESALGDAQRTAVGVARSQAADRRGLNRFVAQIADRARGLVGRQLNDLEELQKKYGKDVEILRELIAVDQHGVATRRHLDNLLTLADGDHDEPWTRPQPLADLVDEARTELHPAGPETGPATRVENRAAGTVWVRPEAVNSLIHIVAALLDNALSFSSSTVTVTSESPVHGTALLIEDMGTGMSPGALERANAGLADPPDFETLYKENDGRLGLFVVGRLAHRHGISVELRGNVYKGVTAVVMVPFALLCDPPAADAAAPQAEPAAALPGPVPAGPAPTGPAPVPEVAPVPAPAPVPAAERTAPAAAPAGDVHRRADTGAGEDALPPLPTRPRTPEPEQRPAPHPAAVPPGDGGGDDDGGRTDSDAPPLPQRRPHTHMVPQLAHPTPAPDTGARAPAPAPAPDTPEQVGDTWAAWREGSRAAETATEAKDTDR